VMRSSAPILKVVIGEASVSLRSMLPFIVQ